MKRRSKGITKVKRILKVWRGADWGSENDLADDGRIAQIMLRTRVRCSRACCGNPRKFFGKKTRQEVVADISEREQLKDLELT